MATTLPTLTRTIDNAFVTTWYEIRKEAIDNILEATVMWAAFTGANIFTPQVGGEFITRTVKHDKSTAVNVQKGDLFPQGEKELETMARWTWRYTAAHVQRSVFDDQKNNGPSKIKDLVGMRLQDARDSLEQKLEADVFRAIETAETGTAPQGLNDIIPPAASRTTGTYGGIARPTSYTTATNNVENPSGANAWWGPKYKEWVAPQEVNMLSDMKTLYNSVHNNQSPPNLIVTTQDLFELYEEFANDKTQIIKDSTSMLVDLGFEVLRFKGKPLIWSPNVTADTMNFLNMDFVEIVFDPQLYFEMTEFKAIPLQGERIAHILIAHNMISDQLRRHGQLYAA